MKITTWIKVSGQPVTEVKKNLRLELNTPGRGIISLVSEQAPELGQHVEVVMQLGDNPAQITFQGFIEDVTPIQKTSYKILIREFSAALNQTMPINLQHCTPQDILKVISDKTGLVFVLPDSEWTKNDVSRFQHIGGGYGALDNLLRVFQVSQPIWQQQPDGRIYVGELSMSLMGGKVVPINPELISDMSSTGGSIVALPRLRPGVKLDLGNNQKYITAIDINDNMMRLTWAKQIANNKMRGIQ